MPIAARHAKWPFTTAALAESFRAASTSVAVPAIAPMTTPTLQGFAAIVLWSCLASLTAAAGPVPPFQLAAMTFALGTVAGVLNARLSGQRLPRITEIPVRALALGVAGLLGYHVAYFFALQSAPRIEANLLNYLWPLLIVLFSGLLPVQVGGHPLRWWHIAGALIGFTGTVMALLDPATPLSPASSAAAGFAAALLAAIIWAAYSVASRLYADVPSTALVACCAATSLGAGLFHLGLEQTRWPADAASWAAVVVMGLGPVGLAFYLWDGAMKHGNLRLVGIAAYATPLLSTALLAATGLGTASANLWVAALLVTSGAALAALGDRLIAAR